MKQIRNSISGTGLCQPPHGFLLSLLLCVVLITFMPNHASAQNDNYTVDVCPKALWRDAIFLRGPSPPETFANVTRWTKEEAKTYVTKTVVRQVQANIAFVVITLVSLLVFLLWRLVRRCCMSCCMRSSCEERRAQADPDTILRGWKYWLQKGVVWLFAVAAFSILLAGIIMAPKSLFVKVWRPVNRLTDYLDNTTLSMDTLVGGLSGVNPILDSIVSLVNNDINLPLIKANLQTISTTLGSAAADPNTVVNALNNLNSSMANVRGQIAAARPQLSASSPTGLPSKLDTLAAGMPALKNVVAACSNYSTRLGALNAQFTTLSTASYPSYDTSSLKTAMTAVEVETWRGLLAGEVASLDTWRSLQTGNTLAGLAANISALNASFADLQYTKAPAVASSLTSFYNTWNGALASMKRLLDQIDYVQANVAGLDTATNDVLRRLRSVYGNVSALTSLTPSPPSLAANISALAGDVSLGSSAGALISNLNSAQSLVNAVPLSTLDDARAALNNLKTSLDSLSGKYNNTRDAIAAYDAAPSSTTFAALKSSATDSGNTWDVSQSAATNANTAAGSTSVVAVQAAANGGLGTLISPIKTGLTAVDASAAASDAAISSRPSLAPYQSLTASIKSLWDAMPAQKTKELDAVSSAVTTIENLLVTVPANVRSQTASIQASFGSGVNQLKSKVIVKVDDFEAKNDDRVQSIDLARYRATCAVLAVAAVFVVLLIVVVGLNCPWGIGCAVFFLLLLAAVLFLLATLFAVVLVVAQDGCYHTEHVVLSALGNGSTVSPLANYYFFAPNNASVEGVLKAANLVDIPKVEAQVVDLTNNMIDNFTAQYTPKPKLIVIINNVKGFVNTTLGRIDRLLLDTGVAVVRPIYVDFKEFPCCEVTDYSFKLWGVLTFGGWLIYMSCTLAMAFLGRLDQLPHSGCCGCKPMVGKRMKNKVAPEDGSGNEQAPVKAIVVAPGQQPPPARPEDAAAYPPPEGAAFPPPQPDYPPPGAPAMYPPPQPMYPPPQPMYPPPQPMYPPPGGPVVYQPYGAPPPLAATANPTNN